MQLFEHDDEAEDVRRPEKAPCLDEHTIAEIEWVQSNYQKMARKWIESEKQKLALERRVQGLEAQQKPSSFPEEAGRETKQHKASQSARRYQRLGRRSPSPNDILPTIESDGDSVVGGGHDARSNSVESGSDGYQGDTEAAPPKSKPRFRPAPPTKEGRKPRTLSPKVLASLSRARARHRCARWVRGQRKEEQRRRKRGTRSSPIQISSDSSSDTSAASSQGSIPASVMTHRSPAPRRSRTPNVERLPAEAARRILPRMFVPSRDGLAFLWEALSIAQRCFYDAALAAWPDWTRALFPQGAHEVSFGQPDLLGYLAGYDVRADLALRGADSVAVYAALREMPRLRNRACHFPPRADAHYVRTRGETKPTGADERRLVADGVCPPDSAGWYREAMMPACHLASVLGDEEAMAALDDLYDRVEHRAWAMLRAIEEIAACRRWGPPGEKQHEDRRRRRESDRSTLRDKLRALPEELRVPLRMFFETVELGDLGWPETIRRAAVVWRETADY